MCRQVLLSLPRNRYVLLVVAVVAILIPTLAAGQESASVSITSAPASTTSSTTATFAWTAPGVNGNTWCSLDGSSPAVCSSPASYSNLSVGSHTFAISAQQKSNTAASVSWTITAPAPPTPAPTISLTQKPASSTTSTGATFAWSTTNATSVSCKLDGGSASSCSSPTSFSSLATGSHTFVATATGAGGNVSTSYSWSITAAPAPAPTPTTPAPTISFTQTPPSSTTSTGATFVWSTTNATSVSCKLDGGSASSCASPKSLSSLATGSHTFVATATGAGGSTSTSYTWSITTTTTTTTSDLAKGKPASASSTDGSLAPGLANDGNSGTRWSSAWQNSQWWQVDLGSVAQVSSVSLNWETAYASSYKIQLSTDGASFTDAASVNISAAGWKTTSFTTASARYVRILGVTRATQYGISLWDAQVLGSAGSGGAAPAPASNAPTISFTQTPASSSTATSATFAWSTTNATSVSCKLDNGSASACTSPTSFSSLATGTHTFVATATGANGSATASYTWTVAAWTTSGTVRYAQPGQDLAVIAASTVGDTVVIQGGAHPKLVLNKSFSNGVLTIRADSGAYFQGIDTNGMSGYRFDGITTKVAPEYVDYNITPFYIHNASSNITITGGSKIIGGFNAIKQYGSSTNIKIDGVDISGMGGDFIHVDGANGLTIDNCYEHDPIEAALHTSNPEHQDGLQIQRGSNIYVGPGFKATWPHSPRLDGPNNGIFVNPAGGTISNVTLDHVQLSSWQAGRAIQMGTVTNGAIKYPQISNSGSLSPLSPENTLFPGGGHIDLYGVTNTYPDVFLTSGASAYVSFH